jgi:RNA polymerase sigma-70 factor (ECF subfamily)
MEPDRDHVPHAPGSLTLDEFQASRPMLAGLAYRLLGSWHDAEDVLQEAYLRWSAVDHSTVREPRRYLTRVVTRLAIDSLRSRRARRESYVGDWLPEPAPADLFGGADPGDLSLAVLHLMERLTPVQRAVYVLRTAFVIPYDEIADILGRSPEDCRQLLRRAKDALADSRARFTPTRSEQERLLTDFVAAARSGDLERLKGLLREDAVAWSDGGGRAKAARRPIHGVDKVARFFGRLYSRPGVFDAIGLDLAGERALLVRLGEVPHVLALEIDAGQVVGIRLVTNPDKLSVAVSRAASWDK